MRPACGPGRAEDWRRHERREASSQTLKPADGSSWSCSGGDTLLAKATRARGTPSVAVTDTGWYQLDADDIPA